MRSFAVVLPVEKRRPLTLKYLPGVPGLLGLIVATSNTGLASAAIGFTGAGGLGIVHAVSLVATFRSRGSGLAPWVQVPVIKVLSESSFPSYVPPTPGT